MRKFTSQKVNNVYQNGIMPKWYTQKNKHGVPKRHNGKIEQLDTSTNTNFIDLLSSLTDGH